MTIPGEARYAPSERVAVQRVEDELVLLDLEDGDFFVARGLGAVVWERLSRGATVAEVAEEAAGRYERDAGAVRADVEAFVASLVEKAFLERVDPS